jgi:ABC-type branched-subunit amino acid transport system ATPase component
MSAAVPRLEVSGLQKRFGGLTAVRDVSFSVHAGEDRMARASRR